MNASTQADRPGASGRVKRPRSRLIRDFGVAATALWCTLGTVHAAIVLSRFEPASSEAPARAIGRPLLPGSRLVAAMLPLIKDVPGSAPVLVVLPEEVRNLTEHLVRQQLSHLAYPRRVTVERWNGSSAQRNPEDDGSRQLRGRSPQPRRIGSGFARSSGTEQPSRCVCRRSLPAGVPRHADGGGWGEDGVDAVPWTVTGLSSSPAPAQRGFEVAAAAPEAGSEFSTRRTSSREEVARDHKSPAT